MKTFAIPLLAIFLAFAVQLPAQVVITFTSQQQIDDFHINYPGVTHIYGSVIIGTWNNCNINNLNGLSGLESIEGFLQIEYTSLLDDFTGLETLSYIDSSLIIQQNPGLKSLTGLDGLQWIGWNLKIENNDQLIDFTGLGALLHIGNALQVSGNDELTNFLGFGRVKFVNELQIQFNDALTNLSGFDSLNKFNGFVNIVYNSALDNLYGLEACTMIAGNLKIENNLNLHSLKGLTSLEKIEEGMTLADNHSLDSLSGFKSLKILAGSIDISGNNALTCLAGLDSIVPDSVSSLYIKSNSHLSGCNVQSICDLLSINNPGVLIEIENNAPGCNSKDEVQAACEPVSVSTIEGYEMIVIYPNPATSYVIIPYSHNQTGQFNCVITDVKGRQVFSGNLDTNNEQFVIDVSGLPTGLYFCKIFTGSTEYTSKLVKM